MNEIKLSKNKKAIVDSLFFDSLKKYKWFATDGGNGFYAVRNSSIKHGKRKLIYMHHCIAGFPLGKKVIDHINGNILDNRASNLRLVFHRENISKSIRKKKKTSKYVGVRWDKNAGKWRAQIKIHGKQKHIGLFDSEDTAGVAYEVHRRGILNA